MLFREKKNKPCLKVEACLAFNGGVGRAECDPQAQL